MMETNQQPSRIVLQTGCLKKEALHNHARSLASSVQLIDTHPPLDAIWTKWTMWTQDILAATPVFTLQKVDIRRFSILATSIG